MVAARKFGRLWRLTTQPFGVWLSQCCQAWFLAQNLGEVLKAQTFSQQQQQQQQSEQSWTTQNPTGLTLTNYNYYYCPPSAETNTTGQSSNSRGSHSQ
eukprot:6085759-Amphidinium_carterae.1